MASTVGADTLPADGAAGGGGADTVLVAIGAATSPPALATDSGGRYSLAVTDSRPGTDASYNNADHLPRSTVHLSKREDQLCFPTSSLSLLAVESYLTTP